MKSFQYFPPQKYFYVWKFLVLDQFQFPLILILWSLWSVGESPSWQEPTLMEWICLMLGFYVMLTVTALVIKIFPDYNPLLISRGIQGWPSWTTFFLIFYVDVCNINIVATINCSSLSLILWNIIKLLDWTD